jgi:hypothetical protein
LVAALSGAPLLEEEGDGGSVADNVDGDDGTVEVDDEEEEGWVAEAEELLAAERAGGGAAPTDRLRPQPAVPPPTAAAAAAPPRARGAGAAPRSTPPVPPAASPSPASASDGAPIDPAVVAAFTECLHTAFSVAAQLEGVAVRQARGRAARIAGDADALARAVATVRADEGERAAAAARAVAPRATPQKPPGGRPAPAAAAAAVVAAAAEAAAACLPPPPPPPPPRSVRDIAASTQLPSCSGGGGGGLAARTPSPLVDEALLVATRHELAAFVRRAARLLVLGAALPRRIAAVVSRAHAGLQGALAHTAESLRGCADALPRVAASGRLLSAAPGAEPAALLPRPLAPRGGGAQLGLVTYAAAAAADAAPVAAAAAAAAAGLGPSPFARRYT